MGKRLEIEDEQREHLIGKLRIETIKSEPGQVFTPGNVRIFFNDTDISGCVSGLSLNCDAGDVVMAKMEFYPDSVEIDIEESFIEVKETRVHQAVKVRLV